MRRAIRRCTGASVRQPYMRYVSTCGASPSSCLDSSAPTAESAPPLRSTTRFAPAKRFSRTCSFGARALRKLSRHVSPDRKPRRFCS